MSPGRLLDKCELRFIPVDPVLGPSEGSFNSGELRRLTVRWLVGDTLNVATGDKLPSGWSSPSESWINLGPAIVMMDHDILSPPAISL